MRALSRFISAFILWTVALLIAVLSSAAQPPSGDPRDLAQQAKATILANRPGAEATLREATAIWEKQSAKSGDYAEALLLLAMSMHPPLAKNKEALASDVEPLARKALELRRQDANTTGKDLALALEFNAMVLEELNRLEDSRPLKAKARELRDQFVNAMQPAYDDVTHPPIHLGPAVNGPRLIERAEPRLTFEAKILKLQPDVLAEIVIAADGMIRKIEIYRPCGFGLDEEAVAALLKWRFLPATKDAVPVAVEGNLKLHFLP